MVIPSRPPLEFERLLGGATPDAILLASDFDGTLAPTSVDQSGREPFPARWKPCTASSRNCDAC